MTRPIINLQDLQFEPWDKAFPNTSRPPDSYGARKAPVGPPIGARKLGCNVTAIAPGKRAYPAHNHRVNEEMFLILEGEGELRVGAETWPVRPGDVIACPPGGPETAHQLRNTSTDKELRVFCISTSEPTDVVQYPDSGKVAYGVMAPGPDGKPQLFRGIGRADEGVGYWDGE